MKNKIMFILLILSLGINLFLFGKWLLFEWGYEPTEEEKIITS